MGLRDSPERAELEPLATVLEVSVPVTSGGVSDLCSKGGYSYKGLSAVGILGNFGCLVQIWSQARHCHHCRQAW